jgi:hypothetical protein
MKPHSDPKVDYAFKHVFGREQSKPALGDLIMISQSERDCELYASRVKMRRDMNTALAEREELGEARGLEKGRVAVQARRIQSLQRLLRQEITSTEQLKTRPFPDLENLAVQLENQLSAKVADGS